MYEVDCMTSWVVLRHLKMDTIVGSLSGSFFVTLVKTEYCSYYPSHPITHK